MGFDDLIISINVSTRQFQNSDLYQDLQEAMKKSAIKKGHLAIEITEGILMNHLEASLRTLNKIKSLGISVYLDDFGTGYSSLSYLKKFPIDTLKIDKSFIDDIHEDSSKNSAPLVNTIVAMGKNLGIHIVAEGVESKCQLDYLKSIDCDTIQGYYFSKPIPEAAFIELFQKENS